MNQRDSEAKTLQLLETWRDEPIDGSLLGVQDQRQLQYVARTLRGVAQRRVRRARWRRTASALAVAAAVLGLTVGGWWVNHEPAQPSARPATVAPAQAGAAQLVLAAAEGELQVRDAAGQVLARGAPLGVGASLETQVGTATLEFASGARAHLAHATQLSIQATGIERREALSLARGVVEVEVPRLAQPVEFSVQTPDARVVVHGTRFSVRVDPDASTGPLTHVVVTRGLVAVLAGGEQSWVRAGEEWPPRAAAIADEAAERSAGEPEPPRIVPPAAEREAPPGARRARRHGAQPADRRIDDRHSLAAENRLLAAAMAKHKAGDLSGALLDIERLIRQYPDTLLMQEARVERFRLLRLLGRRAEAVHEARSYLGDYHDGYARDEARGVALENP